MALDKLGDNTYILRGSPSTLIYDDGDLVYIVDPGHGRKRAKQLSKHVDSFSKPHVILITHYHSDHYSLLSLGRLKGRIAASDIDEPAIRNARIRIALTFGLPLMADDPLLLYEASEVEVDVTVKPGSRLGPLKLIPLPGHTLGQIGVLSPDGILYAADSLFGDKVLGNYGVPYHLDPCMALESLKSLYKLVDSISALVPSHGPLASGDNMYRLIELNIERLEDAWRLISELLSEPLSISQLAGRLASNYNVDLSPPILLLLETAIRGYLACMRDQVEVVVEGAMLKWRLQRR